jgi:hypothetical protein
MSRMMVDYQGHRTDAIYRYSRVQAPRCSAYRGVGGESKTAFTIFQPKEKVEEKPRVSRFGNAPVVTYTKLPAEQTGKVASVRSAAVPEM